MNFSENSREFELKFDESINVVGGEGGGADGITPHIGTNGNWWIGNEDTGVRAEGVSVETYDVGDEFTSVVFTDGSVVKIPNGADGFSPKISVNKVGKITTITITDANGTQTATIEDGEDGSNIGGGSGSDGKDGIGIEKIDQTTKSAEDDGINVITITLTDGSKHTFEVQNGSSGSDGKDGNNGSPGKDGVSATHSWDGTVLTVKSASGESSSDLKGEAGEDGFSPIVGVSKVGKVTTITIQDKDGVKTATIQDGEGGGTGANGNDGIGIASIVQTTKSTEDDGINIMTITLTDGSTHTFEVQNGSKGSDGESIGVANYDADDDYTTVAFTNGDVIQIPSGVGIKNIRLSKQTDTGNTYTVELTNGQDYDFVAPAGPVGATGANGKDGYTPIKGTDYFTENDKKELIASLSQVETPQIVSSIEEMTDPTKHYVNLNTGTIWAHRTTTTDGETVLVPNFTNLIKFDASGNPTNVALNQRYSGSAGAAVGYLASEDGSFAITDFIINSSDSPVFYINKKPVGQSKVANFFSETEVLNGVSTLNATQWENGENGEYKWSVSSNTRYKKFSAQISTSAIAADSIKGLIVTINEPIAYTEQKTEGTTVSEWYDTGISYSPTFKTDLIGVMGEDNVIYLSDNLPSGTYTLKYPDNDYETIGTISK